MANRFLNNITINDQYTLPSSDGTDGQVLSTTGAADGTTELVFVDQSTLNSGSAERTEILVKNLEGSALSKGDPVYIIGSVGASERLKVGLADAGVEAKMPCVGLLTQDLANNGEGTAIVTGKLKNLITSPIDGATSIENDTIYVKSGGGLTLTKPTGSTNLIQNVGQVGRVSTSSDGNIVVSAILRSNDVPNLPTGKIWVGDGNTTVSDVVYLDEANERMGIGTTNPLTPFHVKANWAFPTVGKFESGVSSAYIQISSTGQSGADSGYIGHDSSRVMTFLGNTFAFVNSASGEKMRIDSSGNVGIGTSNPTHALDVSGTIATDSSFLAVATLPSISFIDTIGGGEIFTSIGSMYFKTGIGTTTTKIAILSGGNVGIGTTSPTEKLHIAESNSPTIKFSPTNPGQYPVYGKIETNAGFLTWANVTLSGGIVGSRWQYTAPPIPGRGDTYINLHDTNGIDVIVNDSQVIKIEDGGDVGIGTNSPSQKLHVAGNARVTGAYYDSNNSPGTSNQVLVSTVTGTDWIDGSAIPGVPDGSGTANYTARWIDTDTLGTGVLYDNGTNVGIGTTSPSYKLDVSGDGAFGGTTISANTGLTVRARSGDLGDIRIRFDAAGTLQRSYISDYYTGEASNIGFERNNSTGTGIITFDTSNSSFSPSERMRIDSSGNVGIGTTSPQSKLHVSSDSDPTIIVGTTTANQANSGKISFREIPSVSEFELRYNGSSNRFDIWNWVGGEAISILRSNSNVGIGTTSPGAKLTVVDDILLTGSSPSLTLTDATSSFVIKTNTAGEGIVQTSGTSKPIRFFRNNGSNESMRIDGNGNVGIGTTSPVAKLEVEGGDHLLQLSTTSSSGSPYMSFNQAGTRRSFIQHSDSGDYLKLASEYGGISFFTGTGGTETQKMTILSGGNVGIGTPSPSNKLDVNGIIEADKLILPTVGTNGAGTVTTPAGKLDIRSDSSWSNSAIVARGTTNQNPVLAFYRPSGSAAISYPWWLEANGSTFQIKTGSAANIGSESVSAKVTINSSGNVAIGTTNPQEKLHVYNGSAYITPIAYAASQNDWVIRAGAYNNTSFDQGLKLKSTSGGVSYMAFETAHSGGETMVLRSGNVGIGTDSPGEKLSVAPDTDVSAEIGKAHIGQVGFNDYAGFSHVDQNTQQGYALIQYSDGSTYINANTGKNIRFRIANSDKMTLNSSGNVGIGTTNPQSLLQVGHTSATSNVAVRAQSGDSYQAGFEAYGLSQGTGYMYVGQSSTYGGGVAYNGDGTPASFDSGTIGNDKITFFRRDGGTDTAVIWYQYNSNDVNFRGDVIAYATSDEKLKDNINLIPNSIEKIKALRGVTFEWNEKSNKEVGKKEIGVIAQDVEKVLPEIVKTRDNGYKAVDYQKLTAVLIEAIKEQQKQIDELKKQLDAFTK